MNKKICAVLKKKGKFKRIMCEICRAYNHCADKHEDEQGYNDELRINMHANNDGDRDYLGKL